MTPLRTGQACRAGASASATLTVRGRDHLRSAASSRIGQASARGFLRLFGPFWSLRVSRRKAIVGVVPRQDHEIEGGAEFHLKLSYDRKQVDEIPLCSPGEMKVANVSNGKRTLVSLIHASAPMSAVGVCGAFDAHAGLRSEANPTQRAIDTRAKLPRIMNIVG